MAQLLIVTDDASDWCPYLPSERMVTVNDYLDMGAFTDNNRVQVLNLCRSYDYLTTGYYCSLMAEARGHRVIPSVMTINDLSQDRFFSLPQAGLEHLPPEQTQLQFKLFFGHSEREELARIGHKIFERFNVPVLDVVLVKGGNKWQVSHIAPFPFQALTDEEQDLFAHYLQAFSQKVWRAPKRKKAYRYEMAMLVDDDEKMPPSNHGAIKRFIKAANRIGMDMQLLGRRDMGRLGEFDGLFIRATTNISNFTYRFAKNAEQMGLVVMDDPESIMKCTNKVFLTELLMNHKIPVPKSLILNGSDPQWETQLLTTIGLPAVLKVPDGAFSLGVVKVKDIDSLRAEAQRIFAHSTLMLAQEYLPTAFDWRIGILNRQPVYACRYYMSRGHWQIYEHHKNGKFTAGGYDAQDLKQVPSQVVDAALKSANLIGSGFYGVDLKEVDGQPYVIEINDNPSIDHGIEDLFYGDLLYDRIMTEFLRRIQLRGL
ncbi:RimK family protein [Shewanella sp. YIC-542]|uniref:RimK family protein n=1 Tax=Shewanella mytili TaxID=3377111 RepID=UPI00398F4428